MGVSLDRELLVAGYRPAMFKNALRGYARTSSPSNLIDLKSVFPLRRDGAIIFEECLERGLIDPETLTLTPAGETLARAKAQKRTPFEKAEKLLDQFLGRAEAVNADPDAISQVDEIWLFGSLMRREATVGDIDLAVCTSRKPRFKSDHDARDQHARELISKIEDPPTSWQFPGEREAWLERRSLYGARRHPLLAGVQQGTTDLESLAVPCQLIFDRQRGGRVRDAILDRHPRSTGRDASLDPPAEIPDLAPGAMRPMDGRWIAAYSSWGVVSPYDIFRGWTDDARRIFAHYPENLRVLGDDHELRGFPWTPKRLTKSGLDGRSSLLVVDATRFWGLSLVLHRAIDISGTAWTLRASFGDVELHRSRKRIDLASVPPIVGAIALILAVDAERLLRRANELPVVPQVRVRIASDGMNDEFCDYVAEPIREMLRSRAIRIEPEGWDAAVKVMVD